MCIRDRWEGNLKLADSEEYDDAVELRTVDEDQLVLTVRLARTSARSRLTSVGTLRREALYSRWLLIPVRCV